MKTQKKFDIINLDVNIRYKFDELNSDFLNYHSDRWVNPESPTPLELEHSVKSEIFQLPLLKRLGIDIRFETKSKSRIAKAKKEIESLEHYSKSYLANHCNYYSKKESARKEVAS